jgi:L-ascorbate metabolism protein UlaG (beta-lactamase superfamily)
MELAWLGRSCFQLTTRVRTRVLFDPYLDNYREQEERPFPLPDAVCISHGHLDHFADVPDLIRGDSPALVVAIPQLCRALRELMPETQHRLFPLVWGDQTELQAIGFRAFRSPPLKTSLYDMFEEFGVSQVLDFLQACRQLADDILYLPLTSFGVEVDGLRLLHFVAENGDEEDGVDVGDISACFAPDVALVGVMPGEEVRSAEYAAALGAPLVIPHHYEASGNWPAADLDVFAQELARLAPGAALRMPALMETITLQ